MKNGKGVILTTKTKKASPAKSTNSIMLGKDGRRTMESIKGLLKGYRPAHTKLAQRRASGILQAQKPLKKQKQKSD